MPKTGPLNRKEISHRDGLLAEAGAAFLLRLKGYRILARRYKTPVGEVDIIAARGRTLVFVEVKARQTPAQAIESLTPGMRGRIGRAAAHFLAAHPRWADKECRFDLVAVSLPFQWRHLDNAWQPRP